MFAVGVEGCSEEVVVWFEVGGIEGAMVGNYERLMVSCPKTGKGP